MTDADLLLGQIAEHPDDDTLACMCQDELQDTDGYGPGRAAARVWAERYLATEARTLSRATYLMRADTESGQYLRSVILRYLRRPLDWTVSILVVPGAAAPGTTRNQRRIPTLAPYAHLVTVGAEWVMRWWHDRQTELQRRAARPSPGRQRHS